MKDRLVEIFGRLKPTRVERDFEREDFELAILTAAYLKDKILIEEFITRSEELRRENQVSSIISKLR